MPRDRFAHVTQWVFDLDNTLYPPSVRLFDQIEARMVRFVMDLLGVTRAEADRLRRHYWREHGTTLAGLMQEHDMPPQRFLKDVHDICFAALTPDPALRAAIANLPGRAIVYTNGSAPYAARVLEGRWLGGLFDAVYGVEHAGFVPKPHEAAFARVFTADGMRPNRAAMFEDEARNLAVPHALGMRTVHVAPQAEPATHVHHHTDDLTAFLDRIA